MPGHFETCGRRTKPKTSTGSFHVYSLKLERPFSTFITFVSLWHASYQFFTHFKSLSVVLKKYVWTAFLQVNIENVCLFQASDLKCKVNKLTLIWSHQELHDCEFRYTWKGPIKYEKNNYKPQTAMIIIIIFQ